MITPADVLKTCQALAVLCDQPKPLPVQAIMTLDRWLAEVESVPHRGWTPMLLAILALPDHPHYRKELLALQRRCRGLMPAEAVHG